MESKTRLKPNWFITSEEKIDIKICPACGSIMEKVPHTPKNKPPLYQCLTCSEFSPDYYFGISDLR